MFKKFMIKKIFFFLLCVISGFSTFSQQKQVDSLENLLSTEKDQLTRIEILSELCEVCEVKDNLKYAQPTIEAINKLLSSAKDEARINLLIKKIHAIKCVEVYYKEKNDFNNTLKSIQQRLPVYVELHDTSQIENTFSDIVTYIFQKGSVTAAMDTAFLRLEAHERAGYIRGIAEDLRVIASLYGRIRNNEKAIDYYLRAIKEYEKIGDDNSILYTYYNLGLHHDLKRDYVNALPYKLKYLSGIRKKNDLRQITKALFGVAITYKNLNDSANALKYGREVISVSRQINDFIALAWGEQGMGDVFLHFGDPEKALSHYNLAHTIFEPIQNKGFLEPLLRQMGEAYLAVNDLPNAIRYAERALEYSKEINGLYNKKDDEFLMYRVYEASGNKLKSMEHRINFMLLNDSIKKAEDQSALLEREARHELEQNDFRRKVEQEKKDAVADEEKQKQTVIRNALVAGFVLLLIIILIVLKNYRQKQKANHILLSKNAEIAEQKHLVDEKQKEIIDSIKYARRIQSSLITNEKYIEKNLDRLSKTKNNPDLS